MYDLSKLSTGVAISMSAQLKSLTSAARSMEETAQITVRFLYDNLIDGKSGQKACTLVRFYKTHTYADLEPALCQIADRQSPVPLSGEPLTKCLILLGTVGDQPGWNARTTSKAHQVIPLPSEDIVRQSPMIAQLIIQLGLEIQSIVSPDPELFTDLADKKYNVFYVPDALGSPYISAQEDFVIPYGVQSVIGFGGILPSGDLFAVILFLKVMVSAEIADRFRLIAIDTKANTMAFTKNQVFKQKTDGSMQ